MKKACILLFIAITSMAYAKTYYVSPTGKDNNPGTFPQPWLTWQKAFNSTTASDTCYFRGGNYLISTGVLMDLTGNDGTRTKPTCFFAYPPDFVAGNYPELDCSGIQSSPNERVGLGIRGVNNLYFKGLTVKNMYQRDTNEIARMITVGWTANPALRCNNITFENCTIHHGRGAFGVGIADTVRFINCDGHDLCDSLTAYDPGGAGTAFGTTRVYYPDCDKQYVYYKGCRAWRCSDQGWGLETAGTIVIDSCWSIHNGFYRSPIHDDMKGSGYKVYQTTPTYQRNAKYIIKNCLAVDNEIRGFNVADDDAYLYDTIPEFRLNMYNNFAYRNGYEHEDVSEYYGHGFKDTKNIDTVGAYDHIYANNLSFDNGGGSPSWGDLQHGDYIPGTRHRLTNKFDSTATTITDLDFISLDTTGLCGPRQADWSLPITTFGHLAPTSECIDAGTDVGLDYSGSAPDIGWCESFSVSATPAAPVYICSVIENTMPGRLDITYSLTLANNIVPPASTFTVKVNTVTRTVSLVTISGTKVLLTLSSPVVYGDIVTVAYTKPASNPLQTVSGGQAASITAQSVTNNCTAPAANQSPVVSISSPTKSTSFIAPATITIDAVASDPDGTIAKVEFYSGIVKIGERTAFPYSYTWKEVAEGTYSITAAATDNNNARTLAAAVSVTVNKSAIAVNQLPIVTITSPMNNNKNKKYRKNDKIVIVAEASDPDGYISNVEFKNGSITLAEVTTAPYIYVWNAVDTGSFIITAIASDNLGTTSASSSIELSVGLIYDLNSEIINLYPNPNNGHFTIDFISGLPENSNRVTIVSLAGNTVYEGTLAGEVNTKEIDLSGSASGTYILMVTNDQSIVTTKKVIKK